MLYSTPPLEGLSLTPLPKDWPYPQNIGGLGGEAPQKFFTVLRLFLKILYHFPSTFESLCLREMVLLFSKLKLQCILLSFQLLTSNLMFELYSNEKASWYETYNKMSFHYILAKIQCFYNKKWWYQTLNQGGCSFTDNTQVRMNWVSSLNFYASHVSISIVWELMQSSWAYSSLTGRLSRAR